VARGGVRRRDITLLGALLEDPGRALGEWGVRGGSGEEEWLAGQDRAAGDARGARGVGRGTREGGGGAAGWEDTVRTFEPLGYSEYYAAGIPHPPPPLVLIGHAASLTPY
jgi:hypothetical protein